MRKLNLKPTAPKEAKAVVSVPDEAKPSSPAFDNAASNIRHVSAVEPPDRKTPPPLAEDLIRRIVNAIDEWAAENNLSNLPRKIIFEQALAIMTAFYEAGGGDKH